MRVKPSRRFLENDDEALWLGLMGRDSGTRSSRLLNIRDDALAFDFDRAIALRMFRHDNEQESDRRKFWQKFFVKLMTGNDLPD